MSDTSDDLALHVYTRTGCGYCVNLTRSLDRAGIAYEQTDIWANPDAAAIVRSVARGQETVPTVLLGDRALINPRLRDVVSALARDAPHLVPDGIEVPQPGRFGRVLVRLLGG